jgi:glycosyltransferase involved in cell wall biosynthesis
VSDASLPGISVVIPTLNSAKYLEECLRSILEQDYPRELIEIIIADGGSDDDTRAIAARHGVDRIVENRLVTGEAGKAEGIRDATRDLILMVDSDNVLVGSDWLRRMAQPLIEDPSVVSSECLRWEYRSEDHFINRYQALTGVNDPMSLFIGNYDRWSELYQRWTAYPVKIERRGAWERVELHPSAVPTMGANGYLVRRSAYDLLDLGDYLFDVDAVHDLVGVGLNVIARVDVPIRHYFCDSTWRFYRKTRRRTDDFFFFRSKGMRTYPWTTRQRLGVVRFVVSTVLVIPLLAQVYSGYRRVADPAWLFHVPACVITLGVYVAGMVRSVVRPAQLNRAGWSQ